MYRPIIINGASFSLSVELALIHQLASAALGMSLLIVALHHNILLQPKLQTPHSSNPHSTNSSSNNNQSVEFGLEEVLVLLLVGFGLLLNGAPDYHWTVHVTIIIDGTARRLTVFREPARNYYH
eukprot:scaffold20221_cov80-Skeletonema_dohrnii-CCMP3373.AAC.1